MATASISRLSSLGLTALGLALCGIFGAAVARATDVPPGADMFVTPGLLGPNPTPTHQDVSLPASFFGPGSQPFSGRIHFVGTPLAGAGANGADTIVRRLQNASLPLIPSQATIPIEICALSLVSASPITVSFGGPTSQYQVRGCLSSTQAQQQGTMTIRHTHPNGGTFDSILPVRPRLTFTKVSGASGLPSVVMDPAPVVTLNTVGGLWAHTPDPSLGIISSPGATVDHDCNGATAPLPCAGTSPNFVVGVMPDMPNKKCLTKEEEMLARHGVLPNEAIGPDTDNDGIHDVADNCPNCPNPLQEDADGDCVGDCCDPVGAIPTMPEWGMIVLAGLLLGAGFLLIRGRS